MQSHPSSTPPRRTWTCAARWGRTAVALAGLWAVACGAPASDTPDASPSIRALLIGGGAEDGASGFVPLTDGQDVTLVPGAQGGFHVYVNVRVEADALPDGAALYVDRTARREATNQLVSTSKPRAAFVPSPEVGWFETREPMLVFLCPAPVGIPVVDEMLVFRAALLEAHDEVGVLAEGVVRLRARCPTSDNVEICRARCGG